MTHCRRIALDKRSRTLRIEDELQMRGTHAVEIFLHCAEETGVTAIPGGVSLTRLGRTLKVRWPQEAGGTTEVLYGSTAPIGGWISRRFDRKVPAPTLVWRASLTGPALLRTEIDC